MHPGAPDAWYDGVDSDCAGNDDYDQDGDGIEAIAWGGGDCYDTDPAVGLPTSERWDGEDNDCSGVADDTVVNSAYDGILTGVAASGGLGSPALWSRGAFLTASGSADLYVGDSSGYHDGYAVEGSSLSRGAVLASVAESTLTGEAMANLSSAGGSAGDVDGDGNDEVVLIIDGLSDYAIVNESSGASWTQSVDHPDIRVSGAATGDEVTSGAIGDVDGDGIGDLVIGVASDDKPGLHPVTDAGSIAVFAGGSGLEGTAWTQNDGDDLIYGGASDHLGSRLMVADFDEDGYADIVAGASGKAGGAVYLVAGNASMAWSATATEAASTTIQGSGSDTLGIDPFPLAGDDDGSGQLDLLLTASADTRALLFLDPLGRGDITTAAADAVYTGADTGVSADGSGDNNGDGIDDVAIGDPGWESSTGGVCLTYGASSWASTLSATTCDTWFQGKAGTSFGSAVFNSIDQDLDGHDDLVVGAQNWGGVGAVYLYRAP